MGFCNIVKGMSVPPPTEDLGLGGAYNSAIDNSSKFHLLSPQAMQVQGQAFKQALVTQLRQPGPKSTICGQNTRLHMAALHIQQAPLAPARPAPDLRH